MGEIASIPYLRDYVLSKHRRVRIATGAAMQELVAQLQPMDFAWLDEHMRASYSTSKYWHQTLTSDSVAELGDSGSSRSTLLGIASSHGNGCVREQAVKLIQETVVDGSELPFLLVRCKDWVDQVRAVAVEAVHQRLRQPYAAHFLRYFQLVQWLEQRGNATRVEVVSQIRRFFAKPASHAVLMAGLGGRDAKIQLTSFDLLVAAGYRPMSDVLDLAAASIDSDVRHKAMMTSLCHLRGNELDEFFLKCRTFDRAN